jgi:hypothetical protein
MLCPACGQADRRRHRLPESLPASALMRRGAPLGQVFHALLWLSWQALPPQAKRSRIVRSILHDRGGLLHDFAEYLDLGRRLSPKERAYLWKAIVASTVDMERRLARGSEASR